MEVDAAVCWESTPGDRRRSPKRDPSGLYILYGSFVVAFGGSGAGVISGYVEDSDVVSAGVQMGKVISWRGSAGGSES